MFRITNALVFILSFSSISLVYAEETIQIRKAEYRGDVSHACNATVEVKKQCDGLTSCDVKATNSLCGDPLFGTPKTLTVAYSCGKNGMSASAPEDQSVAISCQ